MAKVSAGIAFVTGLLAAWYWLRSTWVNIDASTYTKDGKVVFQMMKWIDSVMKTSSTVSALNAKAAAWTAVSVLANTLSALHF
jgi:hypothetical protein